MLEASDIFLEKGPPQKINAYEALGIQKLPLTSTEKSVIKAITRFALIKRQVFENGQLQGLEYELADKKLDDQLRNFLFDNNNSTSIKKDFREAMADIGSEAKDEPIRVYATFILDALQRQLFTKNFKW